MIPEWKQELKGSESRDLFKLLHKRKLADNCYALDLDFTLVEKNQHNGSADPCIVAVLDFKQSADGLTFTEVLAYNRFLSFEVPVFIVQSERDDFISRDASEQRFAVFEYLSGDWRPFPPEWDARTVLTDATWDDLATWESELRVRRRRAVRDASD